MTIPSGTGSSEDGKAPGDDISLSLASLPEYHLDYSQWNSSDPYSEMSSRFVTSLRKAMTGIGFFYLHNTPLDSKRTAMFDLVQRFFALDVTTRLEIDMDQSRHFRGYCKFGDERTQNRQDLRDQVDYGPQVDAIRDELLLEKFPFLNLYGPNQFLEDEVCKGHKQLVLDWFQECEQISNELTKAIEVVLGVEQGQLSQYLTGQIQPPSHRQQQQQQESGEAATLESLGPLPYSRMKTIRYPAGSVVDGIRRDPSSTQGVGAHKDSGWLTLLMPDDSVGGLQVQDFSGNWIDVPSVPNSVVVNFGQQVEYLTSGIVQSATHRVLSNPQSTKPRYSIAFFSSPALNVKLSPLARESFNKQTMEIWQKEEQKRSQQTIISDVKNGDLHAEPSKHFGWINWKGLVRSHPGVVRAFYQHIT